MRTDDEIIDYKLIDELLSKLSSQREMPLNGFLSEKGITDERDCANYFDYLISYDLVKPSYENRENFIQIRPNGKSAVLLGGHLKFIEQSELNKVKSIDNSQHQTFNLYKSEMRDTTMMKSSSISNKEKQSIKEEKKWWNKPLWSGIILLILSSIILWWTGRHQYDNKDSKTKSTPTVQEQGK